MPFDESNRRLAKEVLKKYSNLSLIDIKNLLGGNKTLTFAVVESMLSEVNQGKIEATDIYDVAEVIEILSPLMSFDPEEYLVQYEHVLA